MKIKACNAFNAIFVDTVNTGVCGSMRCENSAFGLSTLSIQIWVEHFEYRMKTLSIQGSSGTDVVLLKTESKERAYVDTVDTKIKACNAFNAIFVDTVDTGVCGSMRCQCRQTRYPTQYTIALLWSFVSTVLTNKIPYSIHNSIALIFCIDSVDKQDTLLNTQ